jgi:type I restriction enzyme S subunit
LNQVNDLCKGSTRTFLNQKILSSIVFPIPPLAEQHRIIAEVERLFAFADRLEARWQAGQDLVEKLTPSLLAKAFRGELVEQDEGDESAERLLERIKAVGESESKKKERLPRHRKSLK